MLTLAMPIPAPQTASGGWEWLSDVPPTDGEDMIWVIDGSRRYAEEWTLSTTGCGVAVINGEGMVIAYAG